MNARLIVSFLVLVGGLLIASTARASATWDLVGTASGQPDLVGVMITPDMPVNCPAGLPADCPVSGWLTIPEGSLGGPGTTIDLAVDPTTVAVIFSDPPNDGDNFVLSGIDKDGYTCNSINPITIQCGFDGFVVDYRMVPVEGAPRVVIGDGSVWISNRLQIGGQGPTSPSGPDVVSELCLLYLLTGNVPPDTLACDSFGACLADTECPEGTWCRQTEIPSQKECVLFQQAGEACGGFAPVWAELRCAPDLVCDLPDLADLPGICIEPTPVVTSGIYTLPQRIEYSCIVAGIPIIQFSISFFNFSVSASAISIEGAPLTMLGTVSDPDFEASGTIGGTYTETYSLTGSFISSDQWQGTFAVDVSDSNCPDFQWDTIGTR